MAVIWERERNTDRNTAGNLQLGTFKHFCWTSWLQQRRKAVCRLHLVKWKCNWSQPPLRSCETTRQQLKSWKYIIAQRTTSCLYHQLSTTTNMQFEHIRLMKGFNNRIRPSLILQLTLWVPWTYFNYNTQCVRLRSTFIQAMTNWSIHLERWIDAYSQGGSAYSNLLTCSQYQDTRVSNLNFDFWFIHSPRVNKSDVYSSAGPGTKLRKFVTTYTIPVINFPYLRAK